MDSENQNISVAEILTQRPILIYTSLVLVLLYGLNFVIEDCENLVGLVPANTLITNTYVWNLVTSSFFETNPLKLMLDLAGSWFAIKVFITPTLEQFGLYFVFTILACSLGTSAYCFIRFFATGLEELLITPIYGFNGVFMAILMMIRQQHRNQSVVTAFPQVTYQHLPVLLLIMQLLCALIGLQFLTTDLPFTLAAFFFSWSWLRFYYKFTETDQWGDRAEDFSFVAMFPEILHIVLVPLTTAFYNIFALVGVFPVLEAAEKKAFHHLRHTAESASVAAGNDAQSASPVAAKPDIVSERRRAKAMKLLDAKMAELSQEPEGWDEEADTGAPASGGDIESGGAAAASSHATTSSNATLLNKFKI